MSAHAQPWLSPEEYLAIERAAEFRSEYFDGVMYAMAGGSHIHSHIMGNLTREFGIALKKRPGLVMPADARVRMGKGFCIATRTWSLRASRASMPPRTKIQS